MIDVTLAPFSKGKAVDYCMPMNELVARLQAMKVFLDGNCAAAEFCGEAAPFTGLHAASAKLGDAINELLSCLNPKAGEPVPFRPAVAVENN